MTINKLFSWLLCCCTAIGLSSQNIFSGNIKNQNHGNLAGVSIYLSDLKTGTKSNKDGNFEFRNLKSGIYLIEISLLGYKSLIHSISISKDTNISFEMSTSINELNEVIVTGVSRSSEIRYNPVIIKTVDRNTMNQNGSTNLIDALKHIPGVNQITTGAAISKPTIRGLGYNRIITLNNGVRQEGQQWGDEHGIEIDEYTVDRVEIVKGPGSLMYGSDGIAGVLNFLAPKLPSLGEIKTQFISNYQSNNNLLGYSISNTGNKNGFQWLGRYSNKWASNYQNAYDGKVLNSGFREFDGTLFLGINKSWGHSHLTISTFNQILNLPEGERDILGNFTFINSNGDAVTASPQDYSGYQIGYPHQEINHLRISANQYIILKKGTIHADLGFQNNKRIEFGNPTNPNDIALYFDLNTLNYNFRYHFQKKNGWETSLGTSGMYQSNTNKGLEFLIPNYHFLDAGTFVSTQKTFGKLTIAGGIRFDNRYVHSDELYLDSIENPISVPDSNSSQKFNSFTNNYNGISGSIGLSYRMHKSSTLKINISRGFRAPNIAELASNGRHEGTFRYEIGNPNLKPEISHQIDLAYFLNTEHVTFEMTPYINLISNYIFTEKLKDANGQDSIPDPKDPAPAYKFTSGNATIFGGEIYFDLHPHPFDWLHFENSFSYVQALQNNQPDSSHYLPFIPAPKYRGEIKAQFKTVGKIFSNAYVKFSLDYVLAQNNFFSANGTETATPSYGLLSAGIGASIKGYHRNDFMNLYISGENLANVAYQSHLSRLKYAPMNPATGRMGIFNMGRNFSLKLVMNF
jgi:iron complex outermembrane receptor protein